MAELRTRQTLFETLKSDRSEQGWHDYIQYYKAYILALLKGMNIAPSDREDLLQDVLVKCWQKIPEFDYNPERGKFRSWLTIMVRNTVRDFIKSKAHKNRQLESDIDEAYTAGKLQSSSEMDLMADKEWRIYVAKLAWGNVSQEFSQNLLDSFLRSSQGEKVADIATSLGIAESSVSVYKKRVQRALMKEVLRLETFLG